MASRKHDEALYSSNQRDRAGLVGVLLSRFAQIDATEQFLRGRQSRRHLCKVATCAFYGMKGRDTWQVPSKLFT